MRQINLEGVLEALSASTISGRSDAYADFEHILRQRKHGPTRNQLSEHDINGIYVSLFKAVEVYKAPLLASKTQTEKARSSTLAILSNLLNAIRYTSSLHASHLTCGSIRKVLRHILLDCRFDSEGSDSGNEGFLEPLLDGYVRTIQVILNHWYHVEHLPEGLWNELVDFCCQALQYSQTGKPKTASVRLSSRAKSASRSDTPSQDMQASATHKGTGTSDNVSDGANRRIEDLMASLDRLLHVRHINILRKSDVVVPTILDVLQHTLHASRSLAQQSCFSALSSILFKAVTEDIELAQMVFVSSVYFVRRSWNARQTGLRDQILAVLLRGQCMVPKIIADNPSESDEVVDLLGLLDRLTSEYQDRLPDKMLQAADIDLSLHGFDRNMVSFATQTFAISTDNNNAEASWIQLTTMAKLFVQFKVLPHMQAPRQESDEWSAKRQKLETPLHALIRSITTSQRAFQLSSLQLLTFILCEIPVERVDDLQMLMENLFPFISKDVGQVSGWAMLALSVVCLSKSARLLMQEAAVMPDVTWLQIFQAAVANLPSSLNSRFACHLANSILNQKLVSFSEAADGLDGLLASVDVTGPSGLSGAAMEFWQTTLALYGINRGSLYEQVSNSALRWLFSVWRPSQLDLRASGTTHLPGVSTSQLYSFLQILVGEKYTRTLTSGRQNLSFLSMSKKRCEQDAELTKFLLARETSLSFSSKPSSAIGPIGFEPQLSIKAQRTALSTVCDYLSSELSTFLNTQSGSLATGQLWHLNLRNSLCLCIISLGVADILKRFDISRSNNLFRLAIELRSEISKSCEANDENPNVVRDSRDTLLDVYKDLKILPLKHLKNLSSLQLAVVRAARGFGSDFLKPASDAEPSRKDLLDIEPASDSQTPRSGQMGGPSTANDIGLDWLSTYYSASACVNSIRSDICFASSMVDPHSVGPDEEKTLPVAVVDYLLSLKPLEMLSVRPFLDDVYASGLPISLTGATKLLERFAQVFESEAFERSETAIAMCLDLMQHLVDYWAAVDMDTDISYVANQLFEHFVKAMRKRILTDHAEVKMASLLQKVLKKNAVSLDPGHRTSPKDHLLFLLGIGSVSVKFTISPQISSIFQLYILREHDRILDEIEKSVPHDPDSCEVTAVRLALLSRLGSSWSTLTRRCVYAIVDATGLMPKIRSYAHICLQSLAEALKMQSLQELFRLFVPQILYTWLETRSVDSLPFNVFDYPSLSGMITDVKYEIAAQVVMRGKSEEIPTVVSQTGLEFKSLLEDSFGKCAGYCIARDTAIAPEADPQAADAALRLRHHLGRDNYSKLIASRFPDIVATFFKILDREDQISKSFIKNPSHAAAQEAFEQMVNPEISQNTPPVSQQPSFRSNYLIKELEYICQRSPYDYRQLWTSALFVYVFRNLVETIQPALGELHAAVVVRRVKILVSMSGKIALEGYPLETTLSSLQPYFGSTHAAEDTIGLCRYLLRAGEPYLCQNLPFLASFLVSTLASLKILLAKPHESTTQQSAFKATMSRAQEFRSWISEYALSMDFSDYPAETRQSFQNLISAAAKLSNHGSSNRSTAEGELLSLLFSDAVSDTPLVDEISRTHIIVLFCDDFQPASDYRSDILGDGSSATIYATAVREAYVSGKFSQPFNLWILRVLGRAYAADGFVEPFFCREMTESRELKYHLEEEETLQVTSVSALVGLLYEITLSRKGEEVGTAEKTLQSLITKALSNNDLRKASEILPRSMLASMDWQNYIAPMLLCQVAESRSLHDTLLLWRELPLGRWCSEICLALIEAASEDMVLSNLHLAIQTMADFAIQAFPYILHLMLLGEAGRQERTKKAMSAAFKNIFLNRLETQQSLLKLLIRTVLYLRSQPLPYETSPSDRTRWLDIDYRLAAQSAIDCQMYKTGLLFIEIALSHESVVKGSRRSSAAKVDAPTELLLTIFQNIDEKDYYHGVRQPTSLASMMDKLNIEQAGFRSLSFRGAAFDVESKTGQVNQNSVNALITSLNNLELSSLSRAIALSHDHAFETSGDLTFDAFRKLEKWDIPCPESSLSPGVILFKTFQLAQPAREHSQVGDNIDNELANMLCLLNNNAPVSTSIPSYWPTLAAMIEFEEVMSVKGPQQLQETWELLKSRSHWLKSANSDQIERILSSRETLFSTVNRKSNLQQMLRATPKQARLVQIQSLLESSRIYRSHGNLQKSLAAATAIEHLQAECTDLGLNVEVSTQLEVSNVLWDSGELASSIRILQELSQNIDFARQDIAVSRPELLAVLAQRVSEARMEQADEVTLRYLEPAVKDLRGSVKGDAAGSVFHEFASFCDRQLQSSDGIEDLQRAQRLRDHKADEIRELDQMIKTAQQGSKERENYKSYRTKAKQWYDLDNAEFKRLQNSRDILLKQSLENYLKCLNACDVFDRDAVRFCALWLEHHEEDVANEVTAKHLAEVSSRKFAGLMNQLTSRLLDEDVLFQKLLSDLVYRICADHPYHGMYNMFSSSRSKGGKDYTAMSRHTAANAIVKRFQSNAQVKSRWLALHNACVQYVRFASEKPEDTKHRPGTKILLEKMKWGAKLQEVIGMRVPPATMKIELRRDCNYANVPTIARWSREFSVASGISAPKILTASASNGKKYKELFKAGNDDLRQDAIMEQVFEQVSELLVSHRETRRRNLGIRSYRVLPLTAGSGVIEFVPNTIPINDYLVPAHAEHYPNDLKASAARKIIYDAAASRRNDHRVMEFRRVCERLHPVLRYFFMEKFENPDDWFQKRLNYTRTTAAISMLGHILGLGDRHGHNILLDERTGEVVHIDLGIAFEQGRVLPVPELVPFRLTRDIVDGFGVSKTEGVFRRCCEFTLDALRKESHNIMTILDVLRHDPLYSWSLSPLRLKRLQEDKLTDEDEDKLALNGGNGGGGGGGGGVTSSDKPEREKKESEEAEADRALTVVEKKLAKGLSVEATVNELIQQATDERNLALLFAGWAAYL